MPKNRPRRPKRRNQNPARLLTDAQLGKIAADLSIQRMFGLFGVALSATSPKVREFLLKTSIVIEDDSVPSTDPPSPETALANPSISTETGTAPKESA